MSRLLRISQNMVFHYSRVRNKHTPTLINFLTFLQGLRPYSGLHRAYLGGISIRYKWGYAYSFCQIFQGLPLFKGLRLFQTLEYSFFRAYLFLKIFGHESLPDSNNQLLHFQIFSVNFRMDMAEFLGEL